MTYSPDVAAAVARHQAELHYQAAERYRGLGHADAEAAARAAAERQHELAELLERGSEDVR